MERQNDGENRRKNVESCFVGKSCHGANNKTVQSACAHACTCVFVEYVLEFRVFFVLLAMWLCECKRVANIIFVGSRY